MILLYKCNWAEDDVEAVASVIRCGSHWAEGPNIELFESRLIEYLDIPGVLVCNSGTSALHMALLACGVKHFHEVIVPSFTFQATANAVRFVGATPIFADIEAETLGLDPQDVERRITPKTRAIIAVHYGGQPCRIEELVILARKYNLMLIEDACEALGARVNGKAVGTFGDVGCFSFCANKIITTGEGGALVTANKFIHDRAKLIRSHGRLTDNNFNSGEPDRYVALGYNFRMSDMTAALGVSQLSRIDKIILDRRLVAIAYYNGLFAQVGLVPLNNPQNTTSVYQLFTILIPNKRDYVQKHLTENGIGCKAFFHPVHLSEYYRKGKWQTVSLPVTERISSEVLSLPMYPGLTIEEINTVCNKVKEVL